MQRTHDQQASGWSELWESGESDLWDRGRPSMPLIDFVESSPDILQPRSDGNPLRALVPGCGKGYDVVMLALHGFDAYGLEVSDKGAQVAREYTASQLAAPQAFNFSSQKDENPTTQRPGRVKIMTGDFFQRDWELGCVKDGITSFDLIYDYTFLCALTPEMRKDWARRISELLAPKGILVCLEFPLYKSLREVGPPWGLQGVYWDILAQGGDGCTLEGREESNSSANGAFHRAMYFKPRLSYEQGRGTDMVSVWTLS